MKKSLMIKTKKVKRQSNKKLRQYFKEQLKEMFIIDNFDNMFFDIKDKEKSFLLNCKLIKS